MNTAPFPVIAVALTGAAVALADGPAGPPVVAVKPPHDCLDVETTTVAAAALPDTTRHIDLAICLDTSGSMEGLIDAARMKLWEIVNDLALAEPTPELRVALLTFGNDGHDPSEGWVRVDAPLTGDLDLISQQLFALTTNGGTELVGRVTARAARSLDWHPSDDALKLIIVAGNESADQDEEVPFREACRETIGKGIMINAIYCGNPADDIAPAWREVAQLADGHFASIDQQNGNVVITTPFDDRLGEISAAISQTYLPYGEAGAIAWANQIDQDANAQKMNSAAAAQRCQTKIGALYQNGRWDLVDACRQQQVKLEELKDEDLPQIMRPMTLEERDAYVQKMAEQRTSLQTEAAELTQQRDVFVADEMKKKALDESRSFGHVVRQAVRSQAEAKGFRFEPDQPAPEPETAPEPAEGSGDDCA
ncbi:MAG: vWA domain-containing protein [Planctomycetota bacterium]|jgi:hypothetical protein